MEETDNAILYDHFKKDEKAAEDADKPSKGIRKPRRPPRKG